MRLRISSKLTEGAQEARALVQGLLHNGKRVEPILVLRASDPAVIVALGTYISAAFNVGHSEEVVHQARTFSREAAEWQRECGVIKRSEADVYQDWVEKAGASPAGNGSGTGNNGSGGSATSTGPAKKDAAAPKPPKKKKGK